MIVTALVFAAEVVTSSLRMMGACDPTAAYNMIDGEGVAPPAHFFRCRSLLLENVAIGHTPGVRFTLDTDLGEIAIGGSLNRDSTDRVDVDAFALPGRDFDWEADGGRTVLCAAERTGGRISTVICQLASHLPNGRAALRFTFHRSDPGVSP